MKFKTSRKTFKIWRNNFNFISLGCL